MPLSESGGLKEGGIGDEIPTEKRCFYITLQLCRYSDRVCEKFCLIRKFKVFGPNPSALTTDLTTAQTTALTTDLTTDLTTAPTTTAPATTTEKPTNPYRLLKASHCLCR